MNRQSQTVLDRQTATEQIEMHLGAQCDMVRDIANYGADLVVRAYASSSAQMADVIALGVLLKQIVAMIDASDALIRIGAVHAMQLQVRAA
ncbi:MAG: hypothetical protein P4L81_02800, partial [Candidatus Pacebacteria bacterium]|nr:hypothetical protein [Candidatus Paceibacterota bacterium]